MPDDVPTPLARSAAERVLARALELQQSGADAGAGEGLSEAQLLEVAREVGIDPEHVRLAIAEERTRAQLPDDGGAVARLLGPAAVTASRPVSGAVEGVLAALDTWMRTEECLRVRRRMPGRMTWEPSGGLQATLRRALGAGGRGFELTRADEVAATVTVVGPGRVLVRLDAVLAAARAGRLRASAAQAVGGALAAGGAAAVATVLLVPVVAVAVGGIGAVAIVGAAGAGAVRVARGHRKAAERAQLALERVLDALEHRSARPAGLLGVVSSVVNDVVGDAVRRYVPRP